MWFQDLPSPRKDRRVRNRDNGEAGPTDGSRLGIRHSAPTSIPPTSYNQGPNGMGTVLSLVIHLTFLHIASAPTASLFRRRRKHPHPADYTVDPTALPREGKSSWWPTFLFPLKSVAGSLSAILEHCDVLSSLWYTTLDAYSCSSKRLRVVKR